MALYLYSSTALNLILLSVIVANLQDCEQRWHIKVSGDIGNADIPCKLEVKHTDPIVSGQGCGSIFFKVTSEEMNMLPDKPKNLKISKQQHSQVNLTWSQYHYRQSSATIFGGFVVELTTFNDSHGNRSCLLFYANTELDLKKIGKEIVSFYLVDIPVAGKRIESSIWTTPWQAGIGVGELCNRTTGCKLPIQNLRHCQQASIEPGISPGSGLVTKDDECQCFHQIISYSLLANELEIIFCPIHRNAAHVLKLWKQREDNIHEHPEDSFELVVKKVFDDGQETDCLWTVGRLEAGCYKAMISRICKKNVQHIGCMNLPVATNTFCVNSVNSTTALPPPAPHNIWIYMLIGLIPGTAIPIFIIIICYRRGNSDNLPAAAGPPNNVEAPITPSDSLLTPSSQQSNNKLLLIFTRDSKWIDKFAVSFAEVLTVCGYDVVYDEVDKTQFSYNMIDWADKQSSTCGTVVVLLSEKLYLFTKALKNDQHQAEIMKKEFEKYFLDPSNIGVLLKHVRQRSTHNFYTFVISLNADTNVHMDKFIKNHLPLVPADNQLCLTNQRLDPSNLGDILSKIHCDSDFNLQSVLDSVAVKKMMNIFHTHI